MWVHDDALRVDDVGLAPEVPAVFVFDDAWIEEEGLTLKRLVFLYECLLELPVEIRRGDVVEEVRAFATAHGADEVVALRSPIPRLRRQGEALAVRWREPPPLVTLDRAPDLRRFSRYWRRAKKSAFAPTRDQGGAGSIELP